MTTAPLSRLFASLALAVGLLAGVPAQAQRAPTAALSTIAAQRGQLKAALKQAHGQVNEALKVRGERLRSFEALLVRRERAASRLQRLKTEGRTQLVIDRAMREALVLDEEAQRARAALLAAEANVARQGAALLELFDLVLAQQNRAIRAMSPDDARRRTALAQYQRLAQQRAQVRQLLRPVLDDAADTGSDASLDEVRAAPTDDVETLLEKADLARDLEERFRRRAAEVRRRIQQLEQQRSLARTTVGMVQEQELFGERDYRPVFSGGQAGAGPSVPSASNSREGGALLASPQADQAPAPVAQNDGNMGAGEPTTDSFSESDGDAVDPGVGPNLGAGVDVPAERNDDAAPPSTETPVRDDGTVTNTTDPSPQFSGLPTEQVYLGAGADSDARLRELIASDNLSLADLKRLERKLLIEATAMRKENSRIKKRLKGELSR